MPNFAAGIDRFVRWFFNVSPTTASETRPPRRRASASSRRSRAASPKDRRDARPVERRETRTVHPSSPARSGDKDDA